MISTGSDLRKQREEIMETAIMNLQKPAVS